MYVGNDVQSSFNAYNNARSPWNCEQGLATPAKDGSVDVTAEMTAQCDKEWVTPSKADAIAAAKAAFAKLGLQGLKGATYTAYSYSSRSMTVSATPSIDGMDVSSQWSVEVSNDGVFSVNGVAANIVKADAYPTVGARDAALRSALRMWQAFGPRQAVSRSERCRRRRFDICSTDHADAQRQADGFRLRQHRLGARCGAVAHAGQPCWRRTDADAGMELHRAGRHRLADAGDC